MTDDEREGMSMGAELASNLGGFEPGSRTGTGSDAEEGLAEFTQLQIINAAR